MTSADSYACGACVTVPVIHFSFSKKPGSQSKSAIIALPDPRMPIATRTFRVFVSSTFEDLKEERNALQREVFPKLRTLCDQHGARFQAIDLRWGVRDEAALDQQTMEIRSCMYFRNGLEGGPSRTCTAAPSSAAACRQPRRVLLMESACNSTASA